jgi:PAS domain S-box-containing protein
VQQEHRPTSLRGYVAVWAVTGTAAGLATMVVAPPGWPPATGGRAWLLWVLLATAVLLHLGAIQFRDTRGEGEAHTLDELILVTALLLLVPPWPWIVILTATAVNEVVHRRDLLRASFNLGSYATATATAMLVHRLLPWEDPLGVGGLLALAAALVAYATVSWIAMVGVRVRIGQFPDRRSALRDGKLRMTVVSVTSLGALGVVAAYLLDNAPALALFLVVPLVLVRQRSEAVSAEERARREDHRRLERTIAAASDGIALVDHLGRVDVWNAAMARLTGVDTDDALGRSAEKSLRLDRLDDPPVGSEATHRLLATDGAVRLVAVERSPVELGPSTSGTVVLVRDVTAEAEVVMLREDLISRVSHELRTPLTAVDGLLQTVTGRWDQLDDDVRLRLLHRAHGAAQRLGRLVEGLLARGRIDHGAGRARPEPTVLDDVVDEVTDELAVSLGLAVERHRAPVTASVDPDHLVQVLVILLENAVRYGAPPVEVVVSRVGDEALIVVRDHGDGVPDSFVPLLFTPFAQASTGLRRTAQGLGIGLSIARELAEANGGALRYRAGQGGGACFELALPLATAPSSPGARSGPGATSAGGGASRT